jgi:hypothetical protein
MMSQIRIEQRKNHPRAAFELPRRPGEDSSEMLVVDLRSGISPAEQVEHKLQGLLATLQSGSATS